MGTATMSIPGSTAKSGAWPQFGLPLLFVTLYGSGFVGARLGLPHAGPFSFLALRFGLAALLLCTIALAIKAPWPQSQRDSLHIAGAGLLGIGVFSAGVFCSIALGVPPATSALIVALNPIMVAIGAGPLLGERVNGRQIGGLLLGFCGVYLVLHTRLHIDPAYLNAVLLSVVALAGLACGNLYQKRCCSSMNIFTGGAIQSGVSAVAMLAGVWFFDESPVQWTGEFVVALLWMTIGVSLGAVSILYLLIRRAEISRVASVFYMMPVSAAITAYVLFGQTLETTALAGIGVTAMGVMLAMRR